jgi:hypothetical protein
MLLARTRAKLAFKLKDAIFKAGGFQALLDEKELQNQSVVPPTGIEPVFAA